MCPESVFDLLDSTRVDDTGTKRLPLPGLSAADIKSLREQGNNVAALAGETTDKAYRQLSRNRNVLSHSILSGLHSCARRLVLEKISANAAVELSIPEPVNIDFVFGHSVGAGVQALFAFENLASALYAALLSWRAPLELGHEDYLKRKKKSIERAVIAVEQFSYFRTQELQGWEIFRLPDGRPAIELSFCIDLGKTKYFGHIDLILRHSTSGRIAVGEIKTTGYSSPHPALYQNSGQAVGYGLILDRIVGALADYDVMYFVYSPSGDGWEFLPFAKLASTKIEWIQDRLIDSGHLQQYFKLEHFPKNGANCMQFNRPCQFFGNCDLVNIDRLRALPSLETVEDVMEKYKVDYFFDIKELIKDQQERIT